MAMNSPAPVVPTVSNTDVSIPSTTWTFGTTFGTFEITHQALVTVLMGLVAAGIAIWTITLTRRGQGQTEEHFREKSRQERYVSITSQLADENVVVRMAGVHAMRALIDEWLEEAKGKGAGRAHARSKFAREQAQVCLDLLCGCIKGTPISESGVAIRNVDQEDWDFFSDPPRDLIVRNVVVDTINRRCGGSEEGGEWRELSFDLSGIHFFGGSISNCEFKQPVYLQNCYFHHLVDGDGDPIVDHCSFPSVSFNGSTFSDFCTIQEITVKGVMGFDEVHFKGHNIIAGINEPKGKRKGNPGVLSIEPVEVGHGGLLLDHVYVKSLFLGKDLGRDDLIAGTVEVDTAPIVPKSLERDISFVFDEERVVYFQNDGR